MSNYFSPLDLEVETANGTSPLWLVELRDLARGFCAGLIVALPLLYTMEMWERARYISPLDLIVIVVLAYLVNVGAVYLSGFKPQHKRISPWLDALTAMAIGGLAASITLILIGRLNSSLPPAVIVNLIALEMIPVSLGASLALNQLGATGKDNEDASEDSRWGTVDLRKLIATIVGAVLFAFNVAPTIEPKIITTTVTFWHTLAIAVFSLFVSWLMVEFAEFSGGSGRQRRGKFFREVWVETVLSYAASLLVSAGFLWAFGYISLTTPLATVVPWVVVLGYATTLGGSAGRLILQADRS